MKAEIICSGEELVLGERLNTNSAWLAEQLAEIGIEPVQHTVVGDDEDEFVDVLKRAVAAMDMVVITGGIGPTVDDVTRQVVARVAGVGLARDAASLEYIQGLFRSWGREMRPSNAVQADFPEGAEVLPNGRGTAPGFRLKIGKCEIIVLPGPPAEMKPMWDTVVRPTLEGVSGEILVTRTVNCFGRGESDIAEVIRDLMAPGMNPLVGDTAEDAVIKLRIRAKARSYEEALGLIDDTKIEIRKRLSDVIFGEDEDTLESVVVGLLKSKGLTVSGAESCTGGFVTKMLTDISGVSASLTQSVVAYSNEAKVRLLGVPSELIEKHGAVSEAVARAMAEGARRTARTDIAFATTGIAGPTGGTAEKPVGLVYIAVADAQGTEPKELRIRGDRQQVRDRSAKNVLNMLRLRLQSF